MIDKSYNYLKTQLNLQSQQQDLNISRQNLTQLEQEEDLSYMIYDIIPSRQQPNTSFKNSEYSFSKVFAQNDNGDHSQDRIRDNQNESYLSNKTVQKTLKYQSNYQSQSKPLSNNFNSLGIPDESLILNQQNSFLSGYEQNNITMPLSTKHGFNNLSDIMFSSNTKGTTNAGVNLNQSTNYTTNKLQKTHENYNTNQPQIKNYHTFKNPQHHLTSNKKYSQLQNQDLSNNSFLSHTFNLEDDYRLQLIYLRLWQKAIRNIKKSRYEKKELLKQMATAIHFHEQKLIEKVILGFIKVRVQREQQKAAAVKVSCMVRRNIKKFYLRVLMQKFKERKWIASGQTIAQIYYNNELRKRYFTKLQQQARFQAKQKKSFRLKAFKNQNALRILLEYLSQSYSLSGKSTDLIQFHQYAVQCQRINKANKNIFTQAIEKSLMNQISKVFKSWKSYTDQIASFKYKIIKRKLKHCFKNLISHKNNRKKLKSLVVKGMLSSKYKAMIALRQNADFKMDLKSKQALVFNFHKLEVFKKYFCQWSQLFSQYKHLMKESIYKTKQSHSYFLMKYFNAWKQHQAKINFEKQQKMKALIHFYEKNLNQCYSSWKAVTTRNKRLRKCFQKVNYYQQELQY